MEGTIFDVRRFATHDGDGIRTTVFFKGCPLLCAWCHNPEGISTKRRPLYFEKKCIHCGSCFKTSKCGGVTLSGGEPLLQPDFAAALLKLLNERGLHTAIETALLVPVENLKKVLPHLSHIFADCKIFDETEHIRATKVSNKLIKKNLRELLTSNKKECVTIRTPMIPEYTATDKNVAAIAKFISEIFPEVNYEILNYNPLASAKYHLVGREFCFKENPKRFTKEQMNHFAEIARSNGVKNISIDE